MSLEKLKEHWLAWQGGRFSNAQTGPIKTDFRDIVLAAAGKNKVRDELQSLVKVLCESLPKVRDTVANAAAVEDGKIVLYRGIQDLQAQEILERFAGNARYDLPDDWPRSFSYSRRAARGFAFRGAWGGISIRVPLALDHVIFAPDAFGWRSELGPECEALIVADGSLPLGREMFDSACLGQAHTGNPEVVRQKEKKRVELAARWRQRLDAMGQTNATLAQRFSSYQIRD